MRVTHTGEPVRMLCPPLHPSHGAGAQGWCWDVAWGTVALGFMLCPLRWVGEVGLLLSPFWAGYGPGSLPRAGALLEQRPRGLFAF